MKRSCGPVRSSLLATIGSEAVETISFVQAMGTAERKMALLTASKWSASLTGRHAEQM